MEQIPDSIFTNIGTDLYLNIEYEFLNTNITISMKSQEEYNHSYINRLENQLGYLEKQLNQYILEISILKNKNVKLLENFSTKKRGNVLNLLYRNDNFVKYFTSINTLESKQYNLNNVTIKNLEEQYNILLDVYHRVIFIREQASQY